MPRGRPSLNLTEDEKMQKKFELIDEEWRDKVASSSVEQIRAIIAEVANNENENQKSKSEDQDLASRKEEYQTAAAGYKESSKFNKLKTKYALRVLGDKGGI